MGLPDFHLPPVIKPTPKVIPQAVRDPRGYLPSDLIHYIRSLNRFTLIRTEEEHLFIKRFFEAMVKHEPNTWVFNAEFGLQLVTEYLRVKRPPFYTSREDMLNSGHKAIDTINSHDPRDREDFYLVTDPEVWFNDPYLARRLVNLALQAQIDQRTVKCLLFIGHPSVQIPPKLKQFFEISEYRADINTVRDSVKTFTEAFGVTTLVPDHVEYLFADMTTYEIESAITQSIVRTKKDEVNPKRIDPDFIKDLRRRRLDMRGVIG